MPNTARLTAGFFAKADVIPCFAACATLVFPSVFLINPPPYCEIPPSKRFVTVSSAAVRTALTWAPSTGLPSMMSCR